MLFGDDVDKDNERFSQFADNCDIVAENFAEMASDVFLDFFPWLRFIYPFSKKFRDSQRRGLLVRQPLRELIEEHKKTFDPDHPRDYVDAYFCVQRNRNEAQGDVGTFTDDQLVRNLADLYVGKAQFHVLVS